jgi:hypothetical protein
VTPYRERLTAPVSWWIAALGFALVWGWVFLVVTTWPITIVVTSLLALACFAAVWRYGSLLVVVDADGLRVGHAFVEHAYIGGAASLDRAAYRARLGVEADARAYLATRPYLDHGVAVTIDDPSDPAPYWLISSRRPDELAAALTRPGTAAPTDDHLLHDTNGDTPRGEEA